MNCDGSNENDNEDSSEYSSEDMYYDDMIEEMRNRYGYHDEHYLTQLADKYESIFVEISDINNYSEWISELYNYNSNASNTSEDYDSSDDDSSDDDSSDDDSNDSSSEEDVCHEYEELSLNDLLQECSICLISDVNLLWKTKCKHIFHLTCLNQWLETLEKERMKPTCPICRLKFNRYIMKSKTYK
jgi:hypothetical protein